MKEQPKQMTQSILLTVKKMLGIAEEYHAFDIDVITNINSVFLTLNQLGVGPTLPYAITGEEETWKDFLGSQYDFLAGVQTYIYQRVRLLFDPPTNSFLVNAIQKSCEEFEWRLSIQPKDQFEVDRVESFKDHKENQNGSEEPPKEEDPSIPSESYTFGHGLKVSDEKVVSVDSVDNFDGDNSLPITASGVQRTVGNIETLLESV